VGIPLGLFFTPVSWQSGFGGLTISLALAVVLIVATICVLLVGAKDPPVHRIAGALLLFIFASRIVYTVAADQPLLSDFRTMWEFASLVASSGYRAPNPNIIQQLRTFPYFIPVALVFDGWHYAYQLANSLVIVLCALITYRLSTLLAGHKAALISLVLIAFAPEPLIAAEIASHDIPGTLFLLVGLAFAHLIQDRLDRPRFPMIPLAGLSVLLGISAFLLNLQRSTSLFLFLAILMSITLSIATTPGIRERFRQGARQFLFLIAIPYLAGTVVTTCVGNVLLDGKPAAPTSSSTWRWIASYAHSESHGNLSEYNEMVPVFNTMTKTEVREFAIARVLSDFADNPIERLTNYMKRLGWLYQLGGQFHLYLDDTVWGVRWKPTRLLPTQAAIERLGEFLRAYTLIFRVAFLILAGFSLLYLILGPVQNSQLYRPILFASLLSLALGAMGEIQPRYLFPLWFIFPIYIGMFIVELPRNAQQVTKRLGPRLKAVAAVAGVLLVTLVIANLGLRRAYGIQDGRFIKLASFDTGGKVEPVGQYKILMTPVGSQQAELRGKLGNVPEGTYVLTLFLQAKSIDLETGQSLVDIRINNEVVDRHVITSMSRAVRVDIKGIASAGAPLEIEIRVAKNMPISPIPVKVAYARLNMTNSK
jgi:hypothetical protein